MHHRFNVYLLLITLFGLVAWMNVAIAREYAATAELYADTAQALYEAKRQNIRARVLRLEARATYRKALELHAARPGWAKGKL
mgnify:CR=1 FL=1